MACRTTTASQAPICPFVGSRRLNRAQSSATQALAHQRGHLHRLVAIAHAGVTSLPLTTARRPVGGNGAPTGLGMTVGRNWATIGAVKVRLCALLRWAVPVTAEKLMPNETLGFENWGGFTQSLGPQR